MFRRFAFGVPKVIFVFCCFLLFVVNSPLHAQSEESSESLGKAEVNRIINDVFTVEDIRAEKPRVHPSSEGEVLGEYHALRTAEQARAELKFADGSMARVGSDAYFSFASDERDVQMGKGTALFQVPKNSEETNVQTATATASLTGTTLMVSQQPGQHVKAAVIEGSVDVSMPDRAGESRSLEAGQMIVMPTDAQRLPEPVDVDLRELVSTSGLINGFDEEDEEESPEETDETTEETETTEDGTDETTETNDNQGTDGGEETGDDESTLDREQLAEGLEQQGEEIESGELEETDLVLEGDGTELTIVEVDDGGDQTTNTTQQDAVEQKSEATQTLNLDGNSEVYLGTGENDPPTVEGEEGEIFSAVSLPDNFVETNFSGMVNDLTLDQYLSLLSTGNDSTRFNRAEIVIGGSPEVQPTEKISSLAFVSETTLDLSSESLLDLNDNKGLQSLALVAKGDNYDWNIPELDAVGVNVGLLADGDGSSLNLGDVTMQEATFAAGSEGAINVDNRSLSGLDLHLGAGDGGVNVSSSTVEGGFLGIQSERTSGPGVDITDSTQLRMLSSSSLDGFRFITLRTQGGDIALDQSQAGFYNDSDGLFSPVDGLFLLDTLNPDASGTVSLTDSTLMAGAIHTRAHGPNGQLLVDGSTIQASGILQLYAPGSSGTVRFTGDSTLGGNTVEIAGNTVRIDPDVEVEFNGGGTNLGVFANNQEYSIPSTDRNCGGQPCGSFTDGTGKIEPGVEGTPEDAPGFTGGGEAGVPPPSAH